MRIVAGEFRSRRLVCPRGDKTRPSSDRFRESVFASLADVHDARCLDLFAGTGALGLEALSRGAATCTFGEVDRAAVDAIRTNIATLGVEARTRLVVGDFRRLLRADAAAGTRYDLLLVDPPYRTLRDFHPALERSFAGLAAPGSRLVVESGAREEPAFDGFELVSRRRVGAATLSIMIRTEDPN